MTVRDVPAGEPGEVVLRGGSVMVGYLDDPESTRQALSAEGWLRTGDIGLIDPAGCLRIVGRAKDMFIVGGFNAYPAEIENVLLRHPGISQAAVIGVADDRLGEVGMAFVVTGTPGLSGTRRHRMVSGTDGQLQGPADGGSRRRAADQRHRKGDEGRAPAAGGAGPHAGEPVSDEAESGLSTLAGLRVIELGVWVAAPSAAALLADWGADVIKVEAPSGDPMRHVFGSLGIDSDMPNPAFSLDNRGKRSVVLDLRQPEDKEHLEDLLASADVFISNLRPDALDGLGLEPAATVARHPRLVYCSISGYGLRGDERNRPTYDIGAFWARSGLSMQMADHEGTPLNARGGIGDHITGLAALAGLLAAVLEQRATGRGRVVEVSLLRTGAYVLGWDLGLQMTLGKVARAEPRERNQAPLMNPYRAADGRWFFFTGLEAARHIGAVCRALGRPDLADDPRFADASAIRRHRTEIIAIFDEIIGQPPAGRLGGALRPRGRVVGPGADSGRGGRRPATGGQRWVRRDRWRRRRRAEVDERAGDLLRTPPVGTRGVGSGPGRAHRRGAPRLCPDRLGDPSRPTSPNAGRAPAGPGRSPTSGSRWCLRR